MIKEALQNALLLIFRPLVNTWLSLRYRCIIHPFAFIKGNVRIGKGTIIARSRITSYGNLIEIGAGSKVYADCKIFGHASVKIGKDVLIGGETVIITSGHNYNDIDKPIKKQGLCCMPVTIEDGAWLGFRVTVLPGAVIGQRSVIGAGAVVSHNIPSNTIAVGVPARGIRRLA